MARAGQRRGRDPLVDGARSTSARSPGATTTTRRRRPPIRASSRATRCTTTPAPGRRSCRPTPTASCGCRPAPPSETEVTVHPMGLFDVRQHAIPLETVITRVGANPVPEGQRRVHFGVPLVNGDAGGRAERGHRPVLGRQLPRPHRRPEAVAPELRADAGRRADPPARRGGDFAAARQAELRYETFVCDDDGAARHPRHGR